MGKHPSKLAAELRTRSRNPVRPAGSEHQYSSQAAMKDWMSVAVTSGVYASGNLLIRFNELVHKLRL